MIIPAPSADRCLEFFRRYRMLDNIRAHSLQVARVAMTLTDGLEKAARTVQLPRKDLVLAGALLHDIAKTRCLKGNCRHDLEGEAICIELGYPQIGQIVREHVILENFEAQHYLKGIFGPKEIVYYADKRVRHDEVVSLDRRLAYIIERYGNGEPEREKFIRDNFSLCREFEQYLFAFLDFSPDQVATRVRKKILNFPEKKN
jgi:putative nucleotidyltransferase with HDIG domain